MTKNILTLIFSISLLALPATSAKALSAIEIIDNDFQGVSISVVESTLHVVGANGQMLHIYNVAGVRVLSLKVEGADKRYELNLPKGCYILRVGKTVRKFSIK